MLWTIDADCNHRSNVRNRLLAFVRRRDYPLQRVSRPGWAHSGVWFFFEAFSLGSSCGLLPSKLSAPDMRSHESDARTWRMIRRSVPGIEGTNAEVETASFAPYEPCPVVEIECNVDDQTTGEGRG